MNLRVGSAKEPPMQVSKWLELQLLIDENDMKELFTELGEFQIYTAGVLCNKNEGIISKDQFLMQYQAYINALRNGLLPNEEAFRTLFSSVFSVDSSHLFQVEVPNERRIIRVEKPVLQLQMNKIVYTPLDGKFRAMSLSQGAIFWGLQFSYPQLYRKAGDAEVLKTNQFPNSQLFRKLQHWMRQATIPTPFEVDGQCINVPMRLGRQCISWINRHPQLAAQNIAVQL